jgi:hypothetical protein
MYSTVFNLLMVCTVPNIHILLSKRYCTPICYSVARGGWRTEFSGSSNGHFVVLVFNNVNTSCLINDFKLRLNWNCYS